MRLDYSLTKRDILFARMCLLFRNKILLGMSIFVIGGLTLAISIGDQVRKEGALFRIVFAGFAFGFSAVFYLAVQFGLNLIMVVAGKHAGIIGPHSLEIKDDGLEESTPLNKGLHRWNSSFRVKDFGGYIWIYPADQNFFLVPKRSGRYLGDLGAFVTLLRSKMNTPPSAKAV